MMKLTKQVVLASIPLTIRLLKPRFAHQLAEDVLEFANEIERLESELAAEKKQLEETRRELAETRRQNTQLWSLLRSSIGRQP
jgi:predicted  nucleic acid-binding Zn-ribbon protein